MRRTFARNWPHYLAEAGGLAFFMVCASLFTTILQYPGSLVNHWIKEPELRLVAMGILMGGVIAIIVYSPWGQKSGAHINPAVTLAFWRLGKISTWDAIFYIGFQFLGGALAISLMTLLLGAAFRHPSVAYVATIPGASGQLYAFVAEFTISFILMLVLLLATNSKKLEKWVGVFGAVLIALYLMLETPYSGMSLNPARTFASAFAAREWTGLWIYFVAPTGAMLLAGQTFLLLCRNEVRIEAVPKSK